jgi:hypothetical protein
MGILPDEIKPAMQGVIASHVVTCSGDGIPNASAISQVYYVSIMSSSVAGSTPPP